MSSIPARSITAQAVRSTVAGAAAPELRTVVEAAAARGRRVIVLVCAIVLLSLGDLYITLTYLQSVGMNEGNPIARWMMAYNSSTVLIWWKLLTVGLTCTILLVVRRTRSAEIAAWLGCFVLLWLTLRWIEYGNEMHALTPILHQISQVDTGWVQITP